MCGTGAGEEEVDGSKASTVSITLEKKKGKKGVQHVLGGNDETPSGPDCAGCDESEVLGQGELFGGTRKVGDACDDEGPLYHIVSD